MDGLRELLEFLKQQEDARANFLGLLNVLIGRRISRSDGSMVSLGVTWREMAAALKKVRWDKDAVKQLGLDPARLPPRDRFRYWYTAIAQGRIDSPAATAAGDRLAEVLRAAGYVVGPAPRR
ncbi:MAG: hypothetical protein NZ700_11645 [Gemmataceae bacterium]|nr:hypothetical protein [Gemmataceae bacterium]MDW8265613.1 hypothetical protein [Gemmataceae bacterium]